MKPVPVTFDKSKSNMSLFSIFNEVRGTVILSLDLRENDLLRFELRPNPLLCKLEADRVLTEQDVSFSPKIKSPCAFSTDVSSLDVSLSVNSKSVFENSFRGKAIFKTGVSGLFWEGSVIMIE